MSTLSGSPAFSGIYPMQYAFFDSAGGLDRQAMVRQVQGCIAAGVHGIAVLGLGTEVNKLTTAERHQVMELVAEVVDGRVPLSVTVAEPSVIAQVEFARAAQTLGAAWIVLQPPPVRSSSEDELIRFFGAVADAVDLPIGIQNAPEFIGIGLSPAGIATLAHQHQNFTVLKGEGTAIAVRAIIEAVGDGVAVFNGRAGLELVDNLLAGCAGLVPGSESCDVQARIYELVATGVAEDICRAQADYRSLLPLVVFLMQSIDQLLTYGKRLSAARYDLGPVHARGPALAPTPFGMDCLERAAQHLWPDLEIPRDDI